jgi:hypothetical protein
MKYDSPLFDRIRVKPDRNRKLKAENPACDWPGCTEAAAHRAPKGRLREREYWHFCLAHAREYNHSYNFFAGMSDDAVAQYQKDSLTGHRPTWKMGVDGGPRPDPSAHYAGFGGAADPFDMSGEVGGTGARADTRRVQTEARTVHNAERKALDALGLEINATAHDIKAQFKALVKRHHPDANGGDRSSEDRLREIIEAYNYLKSVGSR